MSALLARDTTYSQHGTDVAPAVTTDLSYRLIDEELGWASCFFDQEHEVLLANSAWRAFFSSDSRKTPQAATECGDFRNFLRVKADFCLAAGHPETWDYSISGEMLHGWVVPWTENNKKGVWILFFARQCSADAAPSLNDLYLKALLENLPEEIYFKDLRNRYVLCSKSAIKMTGKYQVEELLGKTDADFYPPEIVRERHAAEARVMETGKPLLGELSSKRCADGALRWFVGNRYPLYDGQGKLIGVQIIQADITRHKQLEEKLTESTELLRALMDYAPDWIYFKDGNSRFIHVSRSLADLVGLRVEEIIGKTAAEVFSEEQVVGADQDELQIMQTGCLIRNKVEKIVCRNGRVAWAMTTKLPLRNRRGGIIGTFAISKDITREKETEARLEEVQRKLVQTSHLAGRAEMARGIFQSLGNVLTNINISASMIEEGLRQSRIPQLEALAELLENQGSRAEFWREDSRAHRLPKYLRQLSAHFEKEIQRLAEETALLRLRLDHTRSIVRMQQSNARPFCERKVLQLPVLLEDALAIAGVERCVPEIRVLRNFGAPVQICSDADCLLFLLNILLANAVYALQEKTRERKIEIGLRSVAPDRVHIYISDNGRGMSEVELQNVFDPNRSALVQGNGIGLPSCALCAQELGGRLWAASDGPGKGTTFTLELPCVGDERC